MLGTVLSCYFLVMFWRIMGFKNCWAFTFLQFYSFDIFYFHSALTDSSMSEKVNIFRLLFYFFRLKEYSLFYSFGRIGLVIQSSGFS